jgi:RNA polymerase sigma-70 factor (ECF subfamily)
VLYPDEAKSVVSEEEWIALVRAIAAGDELALHEVYERTHRIVFTLIMRLTHSRETAEELTVDVLHGVWSRAGTFDPSAGTVVAWIMNQARSRAIDRLRYEHRKKRVNPHAESPPSEPDRRGPQEELEGKEHRRRLRDAMTRLTAAERQTIEVAFFSELTYAETAARLHEPLGTIKTRIRSALAKLRHAMSGESR